MTEAAPVNDNAELEHELKELIVNTLKLEDISPDSISRDLALFGEGLNLDSIDALEIGIALQKKYGIKFDAQDENLQLNFSSIANLAEFVSTSKP